MTETLARFSDTDGNTYTVEQTDKGSIRYRKNGRFSNADAFNTVGRWRSAIIADDVTTRNPRGDQTKIRIEAYTVTRDRHPIGVTWNTYDKALQAVNRSAAWNVNPNPRVEQPKPVHKSETEGLGRRSRVVVNGYLYRNAHQMDMLQGGERL